MYSLLKLAFGLSPHHTELSEFLTIVSEVMQVMDVRAKEIQEEKLKVSEFST
jgi:hypothetical protein